MKSSISCTTLSLALLLTLSSISFLPLSQPKTLTHQTNPQTDLIERTCTRTPRHALCVATLRASPEASRASLAGLALIMVRSAKAKATDTLARIDALLKQRGGAMRTALSSCGDAYKAVLDGDVPEAVEAITGGDYKFAEQGMSDAAAEAERCEGGFLAGKSPLGDLNKAMHDLAAIASSMARMLMTG